MFRLLRVGAVLCICLFPDWAAAGIGVFPPSNHSPMVYRAGIVKSAEAPPVQNYYRCLQAPEANAFFVRHGFKAR